MPSRIRERAGDRIEIGRADGQFLAGHRFGQQWIQRPDEDDAEDHGQQQIVDDDPGFPADQFERSAFAQLPAAHRKQDEGRAT